MNNFFDKMDPRNTEGKYYENIKNRIIRAQSENNNEELHKIEKQLAKKKNVPHYIDILLKTALSWTDPSQKYLTKDEIENIKEVLIKLDNWNKYSYHYLSQVIVLLSIDEAYNYVKSAFKSYKKESQSDTDTLQNLSYLGINFLICCQCSSKPTKRYMTTAINFLRSLPVLPVTGFAKIVASYYEALLNHDNQKVSCLKVALKASGDYALIDKCTMEG